MEQNLLQWKFALLRWKHYIIYILQKSIRVIMRGLHNESMESNQELYIVLSDTGM